MSGTARSKKISGAYCIGKWLLGSKKAACIIDGRATLSLALTLRPPAFHLLSSLCHRPARACVCSGSRGDAVAVSRAVGGLTFAYRRRWLGNARKKCRESTGRRVRHRFDFESPITAKPLIIVVSHSSRPGTSAHPSCLSAAAILATYDCLAWRSHSHSRLDRTLSTTSSAKHIHLLTAVRP